VVIQALNQIRPPRENMIATSWSCKKAGRFATGLCVITCSKASSLCDATLQVLEDYREVRRVHQLHCAGHLGAGHGVPRRRVFG
jgi:hypothetical protein